MSAEAAPRSLVPIIVADVYELAGRFREYGEAIAQTVGQTQARWQVLSAASAEPHTVPQIARVLGVTRQNVQRIADLLVAEGSAQYRDNPDHRASPHLVLTRQGQAALDRLTKAAGSYHARLARKLSAADVASIHRGLRRLLKALGEIDPINPGKYGVPAVNGHTIEECMTASFADTPFPAIIRRLAGAGVRSYTADLVRLRNTYYGADREAHDEALPLRGSPAITAAFDATRVAASVKGIQRGEIGYDEFLRRIMGAGCSRYEVFIEGRKAMYFGRDGEFYTEPFPARAP